MGHIWFIAGARLELAAERQRLALLGGTLPDKSREARCSKQNCTPTLLLEPVRVVRHVPLRQITWLAAASVCSFRLWGQRARTDASPPTTATQASPALIRAQVGVLVRTTSRRVTGMTLVEIASFTSCARCALQPCACLGRTPPARNAAKVPHCRRRSQQTRKKATCTAF